MILHFYNVLMHTGMFLVHPEFHYTRSWPLYTPQMVPHCCLYLALCSWHLGSVQLKNKNLVTVCAPSIPAHINPNLTFRISIYTVDLLYM